MNTNGTHPTGDVRPIIVKLLVEHAPAKAAAASLTDATALFDGGLSLDSLALLEVTTAIEERCNVSFGENDLSEDALKSVGTLVKLVERLRRA